MQATVRLGSCEFLDRLGTEIHQAQPSIPNEVVSTSGKSTNFGKPQSTSSAGEDCSPIPAVGHPSTSGGRVSSGPAEWRTVSSVGRAGWFGWLVHRFVWFGFGIHTSRLTNQ